MTPPRFDLGVYLVTDPVMTARRGLGVVLRAAIAGGVTMVQLRDKITSSVLIIAANNEADL